MQLDISALRKKAVDAALKQDWDLAIEINQQILEKSPNNKDAKNMLGRAYLKKGGYSKAKKLFKEVLEVDPINQIALKNYEIASDKNPKKYVAHDSVKDAKALLKEPGTTKVLDIPHKPKASDTFDPGETLDIKILKTKLSFINKDSNKVICEYEGKNVSKIYEASKNGVKVSASIAKMENNVLTVIIKTSEPIFKAEKQTEKPYMKAELLDDDTPKPDISTTEESDL